MPRALAVCTSRDCTETTTSGRCKQCKAKADRARGTARERGYDKAHERTFRTDVLALHPMCQRCHTAKATVADHWPKDRRQLVAEGLNPNDPRHGRGLCDSCHGKETAAHQPGGWNR